MNKQMLLGTMSFYCACAQVQVTEHTWRSKDNMEESWFSLIEFQALTSRHQVWRQVPLPTKLSVVHRGQSLEQSLVCKTHSVRTGRPYYLLFFGPLWNFNLPFLIYLFHMLGGLTRVHKMLGGKKRLRMWIDSNLLVSAGIAAICNLLSY